MANTCFKYDDVRLIVSLGHEKSNRDDLCLYFHFVEHSPNFSGGGFITIVKSNARLTELDSRALDVVRLAMEGIR